MSDTDQPRGTIGLLYGMNTLGAVLGAFLTTFLFLESFGCRWTLLLAAALNALVAIAAWMAAPSARPSTVTMVGQNGLIEGADGEAENDSSRAMGRLPRVITLLALGIAGWVFFLMEMVWYRLLAPILGGSTYTYGLILALVLAGIGIGGLLYSVWGHFRKPSFASLALVSSLELLFLAAPFALGDRIATVALLLKFLDCLGFAAKVAGWAVLAAVTVFPASVLAGFQFPLLIGLLGKGSRRLGSQVGTGMAVNTFGAIAGSLAGGFLLLPAFSALGCWKIAGMCLMLLVFLAFAGAMRAEGRGLCLLVAVGCCVVSTLCFLARGPTAFWRHGGVAAANYLAPNVTSNEMTEYIHDKRRKVIWETDGVESNVALLTTGGLAFSVNGKIDGNAIQDASTQVNLGMLGALLHPGPRTSLVIGLGTGSTGGWLGKIASMERVEIVEIERAMVEVARRCGPVNEGVLDNPKVRLTFNDAREVLLAGKQSYDLIVSEPSNPYRAGIVSLFTREFYQAALESLNEGGLFCQWVQAYAIDQPTFNSILVTLCSVFPQVTLWQTNYSDLVFICSREPQVHSIPRLRQTLAQEPFRAAFENGWRARDLEGVLARFLANSAGVRQFRNLIGPTTIPNTDDRMVVEFGFARTVGILQGYPAPMFLGMVEQDSAWSDFQGGSFDRQLVSEYRWQIDVQQGLDPFQKSSKDAGSPRKVAYSNYINRNTKGVVEAWKRLATGTLSSLDLMIFGEALAETGDASATVFADRLEPIHPGEAAAIRAKWLFTQKRFAESLQETIRAIRHFRDGPWSNQELVGRLIDFSTRLADLHPSIAEQVFLEFQTPLCLFVHEDKRLNVLCGMSSTKSPTLALHLLHGFEPDPPWNAQFLDWRRTCYRIANDPLADTAARDYDTFIRSAGMPASYTP